MVQRSGVLIETYWNVKEEDQALPELLELVLIETYWNVKKFGLAFASSSFGINRNILECKEIYTDC